MPMFPRVMDLVQQSMKAANLRHQVISNNISNVNVPDYQGIEVSFEEELKAALNPPPDPGGLRGLTSHVLHFPIPPVPQATPASVEPRLVVMQDKIRQDGSSVDVEEQMAKLAANQLWYQSLVRSMSDEFNRLRIAITEGRR